jgi:uncharacterized membrane protein
MLHSLHHLRQRPSLLLGLLVAVVVAAAASRVASPMPALLIGWNCGVVAYTGLFLSILRTSTPDSLSRKADQLDEGRWGVLIGTIVAAVASLGAIVAELAQVHGTPHPGWIEALAGTTVLLSWLFIHTIFATHYAHEFWRDGTGLSFPGNDQPNYGEFLYFSFCIAVASQVSDVSTRSAGMRTLVLVHSLVAYLFNTAVIALGVNIAASLAS